VRRPRRRNLFKLGQVVATPGALEALQASQQNPKEFLDKHITGNWGDCCKDDKQANDVALKDESRIFSVYRTKRGVKLWAQREKPVRRPCRRNDEY
jgi:hypothetical protein